MYRFILIALALGCFFARAQTSISAVYFGQTHVLKATDPYFGMVGNREALIKVHVVNPLSPASPAVSATLTLSGQPNFVIPLTGPATLPASIPDGFGVVQHSFANSFTGYIPANYMKPGLQLTVNAGAGVSATIPNMKVGAPNDVVMNMFDIHYFSQVTGNYPTNTLAELEAKWPVSDLNVRRLANVVFPELVIPPRGGARAARIKSKAEYTTQTGLAFDGEQAAALEWNAALKRAAGRSGRWSLYYLNIYNANAGGQAGGFAGVGNGTSQGILIHELGHALSLPHWGDSAAYPYKGDMHGIQAPSNYNETHAGPAWAFDLRTKAFIPPTVQANNVGGNPVGTYKVDPMQGGGNGYQEPGYLMNHYSDYSINQMRDYLHSHMVKWNPALNSGNGSWAAWNQSTGGYTSAVSNNGVQYPTTRDTQVISIMATMSGVKPDVNMVYPPIGPYTSGLIRLFDPSVAADRTAANNTGYAPSNGCDYCVRVVQGGVSKTYIIAASALTSADPFNASSIETEAVNLPASGGAVTKIELLSTPDVEDDGLPANPAVLYTWLPLVPEVAAFEIEPAAFSTSTISMKAVAGELAPGYSGPLEYRFVEITGNAGGTSSNWQTSQSYVDTGLQAGTTYSYRVEMRTATLSSVPSASFSVTTPNASASQNVTVDSTQQFSLQTGSGLKSVTGLGTFNASGADKLVVVISTEDANNSGTGFVYEVRYNGRVMTEAVQEDGGSAAGTAAIFFLDNPGSIGNGAIQVSAENPNGGIGCAYALSNTMPGFGSTNRRTGNTINSIGLTTIGDGSAVIAVLDNAGRPNNVGTTHTATTPLIGVSSGTWGSQWGAHISGHRIVASPSAITAEFTTATGSDYRINMAIAEFPSLPPLPNRWVQTAGGTRNWTAGVNWADGIAPNPSLGAKMDFSSVNIAADTTLNLGADRTAELWMFGDTSGSHTWTVNSGNRLTLAGSSPGFQINNATTTVHSIVAGDSGLAKTGAGTLTLTAENTYTGPTIISTGTLRIGNAGATGSLNPISAITNNASLVFSRNDTITQGTDFANVISGSGSVTKTSSGTLLLTGDNTYTGTTTITDGILQIGNGGTTGRLSVASAITNNAALVFNRSNGITQGLGFANGISGSGSITNSGVGALTLNSLNTYEGLTTVNAGAIKVIHASALGTTASGTVVNGIGNGGTENARLELEGGITIVDEALTLDGTGNFFGALSSTSGSNTWAGNITIGSAGTRLGATDGNTLTVSGVVASGIGNPGLVIRTENLTSTVILTAANTYLGDTNVLIGKLQIAGADHRLPVTSRLIMGSFGSNPDAEFDLNGRNQEVAGLVLAATATATKNFITNSSTTASTLIVNPLASSAFGGIISGNLSIRKIGAGTQTLSGANTYTGATNIDNGTLRLESANPVLAGTLTFGSVAGSTSVGNLDLSNASASFGGAFQTRTNSTSGNTITIGSGRTLQLNGAFTVGFNPTVLPHATTELDVTGAGTLSVGTSTTATNAIFQIGNGQMSNVGNAGVLDMSGLTTFYANLGTGLFRVGSPTNTGSANGGGSSVTLAANNTIQAATMLLGGPDGVVNGATAVQSLRLGSAANVINVDTINLGGLGAADGRANGSLTFQGATGTLRIRSLANQVDGRAALNVGVRTMDTGVAGEAHLFDTTGHSADLRFATMTVGSRTTTGSFTGNISAAFRFDAGTLDANNLIIGNRAGTTAVASTGAGSVSIGGGSVTIHNTAGPVQIGTNAVGGGNGTGTLHISGGVVAIAASGGNSIRLAHAAVASGTATGNLNLTGGTLSVVGDIVRGSSTGTSNANVNLNGGLLNLNGHDLGAAGSSAVAFTAAAGHLQNIASINGSAGLTKTTAGILTLSGTNGYSGTTTINGGTLALGSSNAIPNSAVVINSGTLDARTFQDTLGTLDTNGAAVLNLGSGAALSFANSSGIDWGGGTLTITGTFVSGVSLRFGTTSAGLTATQLARISKPGGDPVLLNSSGFLIDVPATDYAAWALTHAPTGTYVDDFDGDGVGNGIEYILGGTATTIDTALLPTSSISGANVVFSFKRSQSSIHAKTLVVIEVGTNLQTWPASYNVGADTAASTAGVTIVKGVPANFDTVTLSIPRAPDTRKFMRLNLTILP